MNNNILPTPDEFENDSEQGRRFDEADEMNVLAGWFLEFDIFDESYSCEKGQP